MTKIYPHAVYMPREHEKSGKRCGWGCWLVWEVMHPGPKVACSKRLSLKSVGSKIYCQLSLTAVNLIAHLTSNAIV